MTDGTNVWTTGLESSDRQYSPSKAAVPSDVGTSTSFYGTASLNTVIGVTTDATKSGIIADTSSLTLVCNGIIKY